MRVVSNPKFKLGVIVIIFVAVVALMIYGLITLIMGRFPSSATPTTSITVKDLQVTKTTITTTINYGSIGSQSSNATLRDDLVDSYLRSSLLTVPQVSASELTRIVIPQLKIDSPIIQTVDGDAALDKGFWLYPGSNQLEGEKVLFCHRRFWGQNHPYSCWYLDKIQMGGEIQLLDKSGKTKIYKVVSINQLVNSDPGIISISNDSLVKIVTCAPLGFSTHRLVVIAKAV